MYLKKTSKGENLPNLIFALDIISGNNSVTHSLSNYTIADHFDPARSQQKAEESFLLEIEAPC